MSAVSILVTITSSGYSEIKLRNLFRDRWMFAFNRRGDSGFVGSEFFSARRITHLEINAAVDLSPESYEGRDVVNQIRQQRQRKNLMSSYCGYTCSTMDRANFNEIISIFSLNLIISVTAMDAICGIESESSYCLHYP
ncbi:hypothetical protein CDAR_398901 [Caerostris darwini]|uniref:Uncharacterized protein n=1 Tax=Caerostris darwini TaxID=1538125 RepID=A0AAV4V8K5_9ARAC|nr:hypothetical protein CDAR_398901 [Caerostris darwini]